VRNAFDARTIGELHVAFRTAGDDPDCRVVVLSGEGDVFSAGADLEWMREAAGYSHEQNVLDARRLHTMLEAVRDCPRPVIARVQGAAMGGGAGLVAASDIAVAADDARFAFSEVRIGLVPAVISTFVLPRIGPSAARELFLTGELFDAEHARAIRLVHRVVPAADLDAAVAERVDALLSGGPLAQAEVKSLLARLSALPDSAEELTTESIAVRRASPEGQEGIAAFLERRPPSWRAAGEEQK
jgi:methylglutaconyl-CoA hydratase